MCVTDVTLSVCRWWTQGRRRIKTDQNRSVCGVWRRRGGGDWNRRMTFCVWRRCEILPAGGGHFNITKNDGLRQTGRRNKSGCLYSVWLLSHKHDSPLIASSSWQERLSLSSSPPLPARSAALDPRPQQQLFKPRLSLSFIRAECWECLQKATWQR